MARVLLLYIVLAAIFTKYCFCNTYSTCDLCMTHMRNWCHKGPVHCTSSPNDDWCYGGVRESLPRLPTKQVNKEGSAINPVTVEKTAHVGYNAEFDLRYTANHPLKVKMAIVNSTQSQDFSQDFTLKAKGPVCSGNSCTLTIKAMPKVGFCLSNGTTQEYVVAKIKVETMPEVTVTYHVPCACPCTANAEVKSPSCSRNGNFTCGTCICDNGWSGEKCETCSEASSTHCSNHGDFDCARKACLCQDGWTGDQCQCESRRGDNSGCYSDYNKYQECNGFGKCTECDTCACREDRKYLSPKTFCLDLCMEIEEWDSCIVKGALGDCVNPLNEMLSHSSMTILKYNETAAEARDDRNRSIWVSCNRTSDCHVQYVAMKDEVTGHISVMLVQHCNNVETAALVPTTVPIVIGVLLPVLALLAVAGVVVWKYMNADPNLPTKNSNYSSIEPVSSSGENPIYISPCRSFSNPTYKCAN